MYYDYYENFKKEIKLSRLNSRYQKANNFLLMEYFRKIISQGLISMKLLSIFIRRDPSEIDCFGLKKIVK